MKQFLEKNLMVLKAPEKKKKEWLGYTISIHEKLQDAIDEQFIHLDVSSYWTQKVPMISTWTGSTDLKLYISTAVFRIPKHIVIPKDKELVETVEKHRNQDFYKMLQKMKELQRNIEQKKNYAIALIKRLHKFQSYQDQIENFKQLCIWN